jgi:hypothetical protein
MELYYVIKVSGRTKGRVLKVDIIAKLFVF